MLMYCLLVLVLLTVMTLLYNLSDFLFQPGYYIYGSVVFVGFFIPFVAYMFCFLFYDVYCFFQLVLMFLIHVVSSNMVLIFLNCFVFSICF